ncbi:MAG: tyrosine-type recombinase/integrase [Pirellulaceae bacterium]
MSRSLYHHPKPFFRASRGTWHVQIEGKQINLGRDRKDAFDRYHKLMQQQPSKRTLAPTSDIASIADQFLDWCVKHRAADTYEWYRERLQRFVSRYPDLKIDELKNHHVQDWIDSYDGLSSGSKRNLCRAIQRALRWAVQQEIIDRSPIAHFQKPRAGRRKTVIDEQEYARILANLPNDDFRDLIRFAWHTGARAAECLAIEVRHLDLANKRVVFPVDEEKMERIPRVIYLSQEAHAIVCSRLKRKTEFIFTNTCGKPWTTDAVNCAFEALQIRMGKKAMTETAVEVSVEEIDETVASLRPTRHVRGKTIVKTESELRAEAKRKLTKRLAKRYARKHSLTEFRHSWCHHALRRGLDALTVSVLMGHSDPSMVSRVYSHLNHAPEYLLDQAQRAVEGS